MSKKLWLDGAIGTEKRDIQNETLSISGADITDLEIGAGVWTDNHGQSFFHTLGRITEGKKIFSEADCENERHKHYWGKLHAPFIYAKGYLFNADEDHADARAAAAILRNIHKSDCPLKIAASVEGMTLKRGSLNKEDPKYLILERTKLRGAALTFVPANYETMIEPLNLEKSLDPNQEKIDMELIKSVMHLAKTGVPSFRYVTRQAQANTVYNNLKEVEALAKTLGIDVNIKFNPRDLIKMAVYNKVLFNVNRVNDIINKALSAGYGGAGAPTNMTGGAVLQSESQDMSRFTVQPGFQYILCPHCGKDQIYMKYQVRCRECNKAFDLKTLSRFFADEK